MLLQSKDPKCVYFLIYSHSFSRYSIWLDSKMRLNADPMLIIEYFLWRTKSEYAISNHYDRHCVWEEVLQNKRLNKYNQTAIDEQFNFYQSDGLRKFDSSDPNTPLPSLCMFVYVLVYEIRFPIILHPFQSTTVFFLLCNSIQLFGSYALQMCLKVHLLFGPIHQCQIYFHASGSMKLINLLLVIN